MLHCIIITCFNYLEEFARDPQCDTKDNKNHILVNEDSYDTPTPQWAI
jgi:hypothetical protein